MHFMGYLGLSVPSLTHKELSIIKVINYLRLYYVYRFYIYYSYRSLDAKPRE